MGRLSVQILTYSVSIGVSAFPAGTGKLPEGQKHNGVPSEGKSSQKENFAPNCSCRGVPTIDVMAPTPVAFVIVVPLAVPLLPGAARFWMLNTLNASKRSCNCLVSPKGMFLNSETSMVVTCELLKAFRPKSPNALEGIPKAQGLNQVARV